MNGDGVEVSPIRVNYILRGLFVPANSKTIVFKFEPEAEGKYISLLCSILILVGGLMYILPTSIKQKYLHFLS